MLFLRCLALLLFGFVVDFLQTLHIQACAEKKLLQAMLTVPAVYLLWFLYYDWLSECATKKQKVCLTVSLALGAALGTGLLLSIGG